MLSESKLRDLSMEFSVDIIELVKYLKSVKESIISNQIGRSGTSVGANIHEAQYAQGKKDFVSKFEIALKEASETGYWLELLYRTKYIDEQTFKTLSSKCTSLRAMLLPPAELQRRIRNEKQACCYWNHSCCLPRSPTDIYCVLELAMVFRDRYGIVKL